MIVDFGDNVPHDADLNEGIANPPEATPFDTGYDPGRNGVVNCGGDDLDLQNEVIPALAEAEIPLVHIDSSSLVDQQVYWEKWAADTGGVSAAINSNGTIPGGLDLTDLIIDLLQEVA